MAKTKRTRTDERTERTERYSIVLTVCENGPDHTRIIDEVELGAGFSTENEALAELDDLIAEFENG